VLRNFGESLCVWLVTLMMMMMVDLVGMSFMNLVLDPLRERILQKACDDGAIVDRA
jgi:hypothetical protein